MQLYLFDNTSCTHEHCKVVNQWEFYLNVCSPHTIGKNIQKWLLHVILGST